MHPFIKNSLAAGILFASLFSSIALCYALTPSEGSKQGHTGLVLNIDVKKNQLKVNFNQSLKILLPKVEQ